MAKCCKVAGAQVSTKVVGCKEQLPLFLVAHLISDSQRCNRLGMPRAQRGGVQESKQGELAACARRCHLLFFSLVLPPPEGAMVRIWERVTAE